MMTVMHLQIKWKNFLNSPSVVNFSLSFWIRVSILLAPDSLLIWASLTIARGGSYNLSRLEYSNIAATRLFAQDSKWNIKTCAEPGGSGNPERRVGDQLPPSRRSGPVRGTERSSIHLRSASRDWHVMSDSIYLTHVKLIFMTFHFLWPFSPALRGTVLQLVTLNSEMNPELYN